MSRWGPTAVVVALLAATAVAFGTTERQKLEKTPFDVARLDRILSPVCRCPTRAATIALRFRRTHVLTLEILGPKGRRVRRLAEEETVRNGLAVVRWHGRTDGGRTVPDGIYHVRLVLDDGRTIEPPNPIRVDSKPPHIELASYAPRVLRRRPRARIRIHYRLDETAHPILYVNGRADLTAGVKALSGKFDWKARRDGGRLPRGRYRLQLAAVDLAGNVGPRTRPFVVRVR